MSGLFDTGCCGSDLRSERVTFAGLWTLSAPLIYLAAPASLLGPLLGRGRLRRLVRVLLEANLELIRQASLVPGLRCMVAGSLYRLSPRVSGAAYRYFNLALLTLLWTIVAAALTTVLERA